MERELTPAEHLVHYLKALSAMYGDKPSPHRFYLEHGIPCGERVYGVAERMEAKQCFYNCWRLATSYALGDAWVYCEGYAVRHSLGIPINHAWMVHRDTGEVFDPTWDDGDASYYGVPFKRRYLNKNALETSYPSPCWANEMFNTVLFDRSPDEFRETLAMEAA